MASSSNRKSSSSASRASKPTFRRAASAKGTPVSSKPARAAAPRRTAAKPAAKPAPAKKASSARVSQVPTRAAARAKTRASAKPAIPARKPQVKPAVKTVSTPTARAAVKPAASATPRLKAKAPAPKKLSLSPSKPAKAPRRALPFAGALRAVTGFLAGLLGRLPGKVAALALGGAAVVAIVAVFVIHSPLFAATDVRINGSEHVPQSTAEQLIEVPSGTTLLNVDAGRIASALLEDPWVSSVDIEREFPHTLIITPHERRVSAIVYITTDDVAWALGDDGCWIAPVSLSVTVDAEGNVIAEAGDTGEGGALSEGAKQLSGLDAARVLARQDGALLFTDVPADVAPSSGQEASSEIVQAGLAYATRFSSDFIAQVDHISLSSVDAVTAYLTSGVEVALGAPEDIEDKELIVTRLLEQQQGVTYVNVRTPDAYTFRSAPGA